MTPSSLALALARLAPRVLWPLLFAVACSGTPAKPPEVTARHDLATLYAQAVRQEARDAGDAKGYLAVVEHALTRPNDPYAFAALAGALDALVWREVPGIHSVDHAIVFRDGEALAETSKRLRNAYASELGTPLMRGLIADALHDLALRVGADKAAAKWRRRAGCVPRAALAGPLASPGITALDAPSPVKADAPMPADFAGVAPFATRAAVDTVIADACGLSIDETSPLMGLRALVVDIDNPREQNLFVALSTTSASALDIGGRRVLARPFSAGGGWSTHLGRVRAEAGRLRLVLRVAYRQDGNRVAIQLWDDEGEPLDTIVPRRGDRATAKAISATPIEVAPAPRSDELAAAAGGWLALGQARRAIHAFEQLKLEAPPFELDLLMVRALEAAEHLPRNQQRMQIAPAAARAREACPSCWEARIYDASAEEDQKGHGTGVYAAFAKLGVTGQTKSFTAALSPMELVYVALQADSAGLGDVARAAYDALAQQAPGSLMLADLDARLHTRYGAELVQAACGGGQSRATTHCLHAHIARSDLDGARREMERLRSLRGSRAILRDLEITQLLAHDKVDEAVMIYDALPPAQRTLALLGLFVDTPERGAGKARFAANMLTASDAPFGYEPLVRLLGVFDDPSFELEKAGAALVARDRADAFLPGAGTAVLRRLEHYALEEAGLLHYWVYDLRRVSGTIDVASGTWMGTPRVEGRFNQRALRRRIYKKDGRVLDTDPSAEGAQGDTDLSQLQAGDYVEALVVGWALPDDQGQLTIDTPDLLPPRTSIREGRITFRRTKSLPLSLWSHALLGAGESQPDAGDVVTTWTLANQAPRRLVHGVPPLEARAAISFGTDSYQRIARGLAAHHRTLDDDDPFVAKWAAEAVGAETDPKKKVARIVAAAGKALRRSDPGALGDWSASLGGGSQEETARTMLERGVGSRSWLVHRALRAIGVKSDIVVSEARPFSAAPGFPPHTGRFTHPLVLAELAGEALWIDADVDGPPLPPGRVSPELRGRKALRVDGSMLTVDVKASVDVDDIAIDLTLASDGNATGTCSIVLFGRPAQRLVEAFEVVVGSARQQMLRGVVLSWLPWADVQEVELVSDETSWEVRITAKLKIVGFARPEQRDQPTFSLPGLTPVHTLGGAATTLGARYAQQATRDTALAIDTPLLYRVKRTIKLPDTAAVVALPSEVAVERPYLRGARTVQKAGGVITEEFRMNLPVGTLPPAAFADFVKAVQAIDDGFMHTTRVTLAAP